MSFTDIKTKSQGFTIVELLIVVVVIAILAAITIVSYNGITNRAKASSAQSVASSLQKKIELFAADGDTGEYPKTIAELSGSGDSGKSFYTPSGSIKVTSTPGTAPTAANGEDTVQYQPCGTFSSGTTIANMTSVAGVKIVWWDFSKANSQATTLNVGDTSGTCATS